MDQELIHIDVISLVDSNFRLKLEHLKEIIIGRSSFNKFSHLGVSRKHVSITADLHCGSICIKNIGRNPVKLVSSSRTMALQSQEYCVAFINDTIELPGNQTLRLVSPQSKVSYSVQDVGFCRRMLSKFSEVNVDYISHDSWQEFGRGCLLFYSPNGIKPQQKKVAAFDMDGTIISTKSGRVFPIDEHDWKFLFPIVPQKLQSLCNEGYSVVLFTNQAGIGHGGTNKPSFKRKIEKIVKLLNIDVQVLIATTTDLFRKPKPGMFYFYVAINNLEVDFSASFFVGDAAGRLSGWSKGKKKDYSAVDCMFAQNVRLQFYTPEKFYFDQDMSAVPIPKLPFTVFAKVHCDYKIPAPRCEVIIMVGCPASGKSHFVKKQLVSNGYNSISRDLLGSWENCVRVLENELSAGRSAVIDNTNPTAEVRNRYLSITAKHKIPVRCFIMDVPVDHCKHNNKFRQLTDNEHTIVSDVIINQYWKSYSAPTMKEGFQEIVMIPFVLDFSDSDCEMLYHMYLA